MNKILYLKGFLHIAIGAGGPIVTFFGSSGPITTRLVLAALAGAIVSGCTALLAFLNTSFAESPLSKQQQ